MCTVLLHHNHATGLAEGEEEGTVRSAQQSMEIPEALLFGDDTAHHRRQVDKLQEGCRDSLKSKPVV